MENDRQDYENGNLKVKHKMESDKEMGNIASVKRDMRLMSDCSKRFIRMRGKRIRADSEYADAS